MKECSGKWTGVHNTAGFLKQFCKWSCLWHNLWKRPQSNNGQTSSEKTTSSSNVIIVDAKAFLIVPNIKKLSAVPCVLITLLQPSGNLAGVVCTTVKPQQRHRFQCDRSAHISVAKSLLEFKVAKFERETSGLEPTDLMMGCTEQLNVWLWHKAQTAHFHTYTLDLGAFFLCRMAWRLNPST